MAGTAQVEELLAQLEHLDRMVLVELAERGRGIDPAPSFRGRCLDQAYLEAVAAGTWSLDDESLLASAEDRLETLALHRVRRLDRRALRAVLRGAVLAVLTRDLPSAAWQERREGYARTWVDVVGPLPVPVVAPVS